MSRDAALASVPDITHEPQPEVCAFFVDVGLAFGFDTWAHRDRHIVFRAGTLVEDPRK